MQSWKAFIGGIITTLVGIFIKYLIDIWPRLSPNVRVRVGAAIGVIVCAALISAAHYFFRGIVYSRSLSRRKFWRTFTRLCEISVCLMICIGVYQLLPKNFKKLEKNQDYYLWQGIESAIKGEFKQSKKEFEKALRLEPFYPPASLALSEINAALQGRLNKNTARRIFQSMKFDRQGMHNNALVELAKAMKLDPDNAFLHNQLGISYMENEMPDAAINEFVRAAKIDPKFTDAYNNLAVVLQRQGRFNEAIGQLKQVIRLNPNDFGGYSNLGACYYARGMFDEAISYFQKALKINPKFSDACNNLGLAFLQQGKYDRALFYLKKAIEIDPKDADGYTNLGVFYAEYGEPDEAEAQFKKAIALNPGHLNANLALGNICERRGRNDEAIVYLKRAIEIDHKNAQAHAILGIAYGQKNMREEEMRELLTALELEPDNALVVANLAGAYCKRNQFSQCRYYYEKAKKLGVAHPVLEKFLEAHQDE